MTIPTKKLHNGFAIPVLGCGTWKMGGDERRSQNYAYEDDDIKALQQAYAFGMTRFDTAEIYAEGYSEQILGKALKDIERSDLFITSKVHPRHFHYDDVIRSLEASLARLGLDYLDLYLLHWSNPDIPIEETMRALRSLKERGLIRNVGVSNFSAETFQRAQQCLNEKIVLNQVHYNLIFREPVLAGLLEYCQSNDVILEAWRPVQQGALTHHGIVIVDELCKKYQKTPAQIAINWLLAQQNVVTLFKASSLAHLEENLGSIGWALDDEDVEKLTTQFPIQLGKSNSVKLQ